jgi:NAD(P)-dependent dehydrogenase (short-subunit alcohol dehydrogenase family)
VHYPGVTRRNPLASASTVAWVLPGLSLVAAAVVAGHPRHQLLGIATLDVLEEPLRADATQDRGAASVVSHHDLPATLLEVEPFGSPSHPPSVCRARTAVVLVCDPYIGQMNALDRFSLTGRVAVVTGGTRGLGAGFARALGDAGAAVVLVGRDAAAADEVLGALRDNDIRADFVAADVTVAADVQRVLDATLSLHGRVDVLVNNAGACVHAPALDVTPEDWRAVMDVNVDAVWTCSQTFGRQFVEQGSGSIVNIGSMSGFIVNRPQWQPAYNASKAAVHHLTRSLAAEWAPHGVRVNALAPGYIKTDMSPVDDPKFRQHWIEDAPMQRYGTVEELAPAVIFLASDASSFVTGSVLVADGGYTAF